MLICPHCGAENEPNNKVCVQCNKELTIRLEDFKALKKELELFQIRLQKQSEYFNQKITQLENFWVQQTYGNNAPPEIQDHSLTQPQTSTTESFEQYQDKNQGVEKIYDKKNEEQQNTEPIAKPQTNQNPFRENPQKVKDQAQSDNASQNISQETFYKKQAQKRKAKKVRKAYDIAKNFAFLNDLFLPFLQVQKLFTTAYTHYKTQNKLPVFFMTLGGILALLFGFGYLMQYSISFYEPLKYIFSFAAAFIVIGIGFGLRLKNQEKYGEFASSLIGLGISINYIVVYAFGEELGGMLMAGILIFINTAFAHFWAYRYETKILMVVSLGGGVLATVLTPILSMPLIYLAYLSLFSLSALIISDVIKWQEGRTFTALSIVFAVYFLLDGNLLASSNLFIASLLLNSLFYLFMASAFLEHRAWRKTWDAASIYMFAFLLTAHLTGLYALHEPRSAFYILGLQYALQSLIFVGLFFYTRKQVDKTFQLLFFIAAGVYIALATPAVLGASLLGMAWALEALLIIYCGYIFDLHKVRFEGFILFALSLLALFTAIFNYLDAFFEFVFYQEKGDFPSLFHTYSYQNILFLPFAFLGLCFIFYLHKSKRENYEKQINYAALELLSLSATVAFWFGVYTYSGLPIFILSFVGMYAAIWWGQRRGLVFTELLGWVHLLLIIPLLVHSLLQADAPVFSLQTWAAQIVIVEFLASLWFLQFFYEKYTPQKGIGYDISKILRQAFYIIIPITYWSSVAYFYPQYILWAYWSSIVFAYILHKFVQPRRSLNIALHLMIAFTAWHTFSMTLQELNFRGQAVVMPVLTVVMGLSVLIGILFYEKGYLKQAASESAYRRIFAYAPYHAVVTICIVAAYFSSNTNWIVNFWVILLLGLVFAKDYFPPLQLSKNYIFAFRIAEFSMFFFLLFLIVQLSGILGNQFIATTNLSITLSVIAIILYGILLYPTPLSKFIFYERADNNAEKLFTSEASWKLNLLLLHTMILMSYSICIAVFMSDLSILFTVALVLHAIFVLFQSTSAWLKQMLYVSITLFAIAILKLFFVDLAASELIHKVIVMMVIGAVMLGGSFLFIKYKQSKN
ncbi:MAG: DUF2339 domain-containing protein [Bernardetiaceae bacterium]|nr:DUF2339 domain-containing protein [Bernardetiaceae bacterium]